MICVFVIRPYGCSAGRIMMLAVGRL